MVNFHLVLPLNKRFCLSHKEVQFQLVISTSLFNIRLYRPVSILVQATDATEPTIWSCAVSLSLPGGDNVCIQFAKNVNSVLGVALQDGLILSLRCSTIESVWSSYYLQKTYAYFCLASNQG
jgi:hypothetical protein